MFLNLCLKRQKYTEKIHTYLGVEMLLCFVAIKRDFVLLYL